MTHIYFVRHATPNFDNHDDLTRELTSQGLQDRALVTEYFKGISIDAVVSSPFKRAYDTVAPLAQNRGLPVGVMQEFRERKVDSVWIEDFDAFADMQWADFDYRLKDGETLRQVQRRNVAGVVQLLKAHTNQTVVVGGHGTAISTLINFYIPHFGRDDYLRIQPKMPFIAHFEFNEDVCCAIEEYDLFTGESKRYDLL